MNAGSHIWFVRHELRLAWRDMLSMMSGGRRIPVRKIAIGIALFFGFLHLVAYLALGSLSRIGITPDLPTLVAITAGILLSGSAMLSQAMENVTRTFYTRSDLELILSSPAPAQRLFAVRIGAMALTVSAMSLLLIGPFIDVLAWRGGPRWLSAYGAIICVSLLATALAVVMTIALFRCVGPKRTRLLAQIAAAVIGGMFVIGLQMAALFSTGTTSRVAFLRSKYVMGHIPEISSAFWLPARAALGDVFALAIFAVVSIVLFLAVTAVFAPRFADYVLSASSVSQQSARTQRTMEKFRVTTPSAALRRKERVLLLRDPWLVSQSMMQLLYLIPPAALLWRSFALDGSGAVVLVPVLIMAAGQLAGGLAWLTISGEDAPDLVLTAPVPPSRILRAKIEAVLQCVIVLFGPFVAGIVLISPMRALVAALFIATSAASATAIQLWFRSQAKRSLFRRRHTSSRIATFSEAFSSITWAGAGAVAAAGSWLAMIVVGIALAIVGFAWLLSPARRQRAGALATV
jgi:ABC-2 type transport system permease protein